MSEYELIDIVDENDNVVKTIERTHEWNKRRDETFRVVNILVFTSDGKIVSQQRQKGKPKGSLRFDTSVGGIVTSGLTYEQAAYKELEEELGIEAELEFVGALKDYKEDGTLFTHNHLFKAVHDGPYPNWKVEAERLEYFDVEELKEMIKRFPYLFTTGFMTVFDFYIKQIEDK